MKSLEARAARQTVGFLAMIAAPVFMAAGTLRYEQAWVYLGLNAATTVCTNLYLLRKNRALLERRLALVEEGETLTVQKRVMTLMRVTFAAMLVVAGLDHRFRASSVPPVAVAAGWAVFLAGTMIIVAVFRENTHASSVIETAADQDVVTTGLYRFVRHPMYTGALLMGAATPISLGSYWAEALLLPSVVLVIVRLVAEERFLAERLDGYRAYLETTRSRLVPYVW
jgi:protein-S-isoprenylcysteine O-methyltransferase Ste14